MENDGLTFGICAFHGTGERALRYKKNSISLWRHFARGPTVVSGVKYGYRWDGTQGRSIVRNSTRTDALLAVAQVDRPTFLLSSPHHAYPSLP